MPTEKIERVIIYVCCFILRLIICIKNNFYETELNILLWFFTTLEYLNLFQKMNFGGGVWISGHFRRKGTMWIDRLL